jgi:Family of unknown function (DUF6519)
MGSDRARETYDETKQYRRVVQQQGRVVLEADTNEAQEIFAEEARRVVLDLVGPSGVPAGGDGYAIGVSSAATPPAGTGSGTTPAPNPDVTIGQGTFYLGGFRIHQGVADLTYATQSGHDWVDGPPAAPTGNLELVYLRLCEHEVSAVEDSTLLDPALGGPDTAQRVRLVRRVARYALPSSFEGDPAAAFDELRAQWAGQGIVVDTADMRLARNARLEMSFGDNGYLGPDNQMIRVQIAKPAASATPPTEVLWAYDDASALYLVDTSSSSATDLTKNTLQITPLPVDAAHQPLAGQCVEILLAAASLGAGDFAAAKCGYVTTVTSADPGAGTIVVAALPPEATTTVGPLFVRVWESCLPFTAGASLSLLDRAGNDTGIGVTLSSTTTAPDGPVPGDYWAFAVRAATPTDVYPARYFAGPQPPDGPREWAGPLAVIDWTSQSPVDGRPPFGNMTAGECCTITVSPGDVGGSFDAILARCKNTASRRKRATICLQPGRYALQKPLRLGRDHAGLTIEACCEGVVIEAAPGAEEAFAHGLIVLTHAHDVTLRGLSFHPPRAPLTAGADDDETAFAIAVRPLGCGGLRVKECVFSFADTGKGPVRGAGIFAAGHCRGIEVVDCSFRADGPPRGERTLFGFLHARALHRGSDGERAAEATLTSAWFRQNVFTGLTAGVLASGDLGEIRIDGNRVHGGDGGFWLFDPSLAAEAEAEQMFREEGLLRTLLRAHRQLVTLEYIAEDAPPPVTLRLHLTDNTIETARDPSGSALRVWAAGAESGATAVVGGNRMINASCDAPTAVIGRLYAASITGNVIMNYGEKREDHWSLRIFPEKAPGLYAVTGNVLVGTDDLPHHWADMNERRP